MSLSLPWTETRLAFYRQFSQDLGHASELVDAPPRVCWSDFSGAFNHVWVYPFLSPTESRPELPWIARLSVNILDAMRLPAGLQKRLSISSWRPDWHLELTLLPEELQSFARWLARLADAHDELWPEHVAETPIALHRALSREHLMDAASLWTEAAMARYEAFCLAEDQRQRRLRRTFEVQVALAELQDNGPTLLQTG